VRPDINKAGQLSWTMTQLSKRSSTISQPLRSWGITNKYHRQSSELLHPQQLSDATIAQRDIGRLQGAELGQYLDQTVKIA
jgi:hypothetical protein